MPRYMALRDRRLVGNVPVTPQLGSFDVDGTIPLSAAFQAIAIAGRPTRVKTLFILCHGFAGVNQSQSISTDAGGMGLLLGRENLVHANVQQWRAIRDKIETIVVYACAAADTQAGNEGSSADGRYLMGALSIHTNAEVYAADRIQWYHRDSRGAYNFGHWEGQLLRFRPGGTPAVIARRAPVELSDVLMGCV